MVDFSKDNWQQEFDEEQFKQILQGFEAGFTLEQIAVYADPKFDSDQMHEIRTGFKF